MALDLPRLINVIPDRVTELARRFGAWWFAELTACLPQSIMAFGAKLSGPTIFIKADNTGIHLTNAANMQSQTLPHGASPSASAKIIRATAAMMTGRKRLSGAFIIVLPKAKFLIREVKVPTAATRNLDVTLLKDMELRTPLRKQNVFVSHKVLHQLDTMVSISQSVIKRSIVTDELLGLGLNPTEVRATIVDDITGQAIATKAPIETATYTEGPRWLRPVMIGSWVLVPVLALIFAWTANNRQMRAIAALEQEQQSLRTRAVTIRQSVDKLTLESTSLAAIRSRKTNQHDTRDVLEEVTARLPDSAWLTELRITATDVTLGGFSPAAANLIPLISQSQVFQSAALNAPIVIDPVEGKERFSILLQLRQSATQRDGALRP
jgi:general secretion pathway protein L